jgi:hypothetical protein
LDIAVPVTGAGRRLRIGHARMGAIVLLIVQNQYKGVTTRKSLRSTSVPVFKFLGSPGVQYCRSGGKGGPPGDTDE